VTLTNAGVRSTTINGKYLRVNTNGTDADLTIPYAIKADQLVTSRKIAISTGVIGTATAFNGTSDITIPVTSIKESYLTWGGKNLSGDVGPVDTAIVGRFSANRFDLLDGDKITIEYSRNGGSTWIDYGASKEAKTNLVS